MTHTREAPERTCVGCRHRAPKGELVRLARLPSGDVSVDRAGSAPGRGAYVHRRPACVDLALRRGAIGRALRTGLDGDGAARLRRDIEGELRA